MSRSFQVYDSEDLEISNDSLVPPSDLEQPALEDLYDSECLPLWEGAHFWA